MNPKTAEYINNSGKKIHYCFTGGGSSWISSYLGHSGASRSLSEFTLPYSQESLNEFVGGVREKYVSDSTARQMANSSYLKCANRHGSENSIGVGLTCSLSTGVGERQGRFNGGYLTVIDSSNLVSIYFKFKDTFRYRNTQEQYVRLLITNILFFVLRNNSIHEFESILDNMLNVTAKEELDDLKLEVWNSDTITDSFEKQIYLFVNDKINADYVSNSENEIKHIFCGSFNPKHDTHDEIKKIVEDKLEEPVFFELSIKNFEKPDLDIKEIIKRVRNIIKDGHNVVVTKTKNYTEKSTIFNNCNFIMGADTFNRIDMLNDHTVFLNKKNRFIVFPRECETILKELNHIPKFSWLLHQLTYEMAEIEILPENLRKISSTQIRKNEIKI